MRIQKELVVWCCCYQISWVELALRKIIVLIRILLVSCDIVSIDQTLNSLLNVGRLFSSSKQEINLNDLDPWFLTNDNNRTKQLTLMENFNWPTTSVMSELCNSPLRIFMTRTIAASTWYCRSWKTRSFVIWFSSCYRKQKNIRERKWKRRTIQFCTNRFFQLNLVDFHAEELVLELGIKGERVIWMNLDTLIVILWFD